MKYLGIDYGTKRVGIALSDQSGLMAFPKTVLINSKNLVSEVKTICESEKVEALVIGESKNLKGGYNDIAHEVEIFVEQFKKVSILPIYFEPEFFTSLEAERLQGKNSMHDASAAALILNSFLTKQNDKH